MNQQESEILDELTRKITQIQLQEKDDEANGPRPVRRGGGVDEGGKC